MRQCRWQWRVGRSWKSVKISLLGGAARYFINGVSIKCGKVKMPVWKQRNRKFVPKQVLITQETTLTFSAGFLMMQPALIALTGCVGHPVILAQHVRALRGGA